MITYITQPYILTSFIGLVAGLIVFNVNLSRAGCDDKTRTWLGVLSLVSFFLGFFASNIGNWFAFGLWSLPLSERIAASGQTWYPGMLMALFSFALFSKMLKQDVSRSLNAFVPSLVLFHAISRIGCVLVGCCYGIPFNPTFLGLTHFPSAELEALFEFVLFTLLQFKFKKNRAVLYLCAYSVFRFLGEFLRGDERGTLLPLPLSPAQQTAVCCIVISAVFILIGQSKKHISQNMEEKL